MRSIKLATAQGDSFRIRLQNWGSGVDRSMRRWSLEDGFWLCVDSGEIAQTTGWWSRPTIEPYAPATDAADATAIAARRGQTIVEYALIVALVGVVAWSAYSVTGHDIGSMASGIDSSLTSV